MSARPIATTRSAAGLPTPNLAVWWLIVSEIVIFGGLLGGYIMHRLAHQDWAEQAAHTNVWIGAFNTFVLLTSSLSAVLAHKAALEGDGPKAARLLWMTIGGGFLFGIVNGSVCAVVGSTAGAVVLFVVQRVDCDVMEPAEAIDPEYALALRRACANGVEAIAVQARVTARAIHLEGELPVRL